MTDPSLLVAHLGGIASTHDLLAAGFRGRALTAAVADGRLRRPRRGWYSTLPTGDRRYRAVALGGRVTGAAALRLQGAWMWKDPPLEVSVPASSGFARPRDPAARIHWDDPDVLSRGTRSVVDPLDAFPHALRAVSFEEAVALLDWGIRTGILDTFALFVVTAALPRQLSRLREWTDDECQSFLESIVRTRMRQAGHRTVTQVPVSNGQWIDVVVDDVVALEVDGREYHESTFETDRLKDLAITADRRHAIRVSQRIIRDRWPDVLTAVETALDMRRRSEPIHGRRRRRPRARSGQAGNAGRGAPVAPGVSDSMSNSSPLKVDVWSDIACPWCFIGKRKFETAAEAFGGDVEIEYHSFELSPDTPVDFEGNEAEFLATHKGLAVEQAQGMLDNVKGIAAQVGLHYDFDAMHHTNTVKAHELIHYAKSKGVQLDVVERLLEAYFEKGRHLGRIEVLAHIAAEAGLDRDDVVRSLEAEEFLADVRADQAQAQAFGINGVPFFVFEGKYGVSGAQDPATFREVLDTVAAERAGVEVAR
jgi:predicted DsbA family dithiol-disulfide isomerase/very-short-patch-repair endonuclease